MRRAPERGDAALRHAVLTLSHALGRPTRRAPNLYMWTKW